MISVSLSIYLYHSHRSNQSEAISYAMSVVRDDYATAQGQDQIAIAADEKNLTQRHAAENVEAGSLKPEQYAHTGSYDVDPFAANRDTHNAEDYLEFRTMGWVTAGVVGTAEVGLTKILLGNDVDVQGIALGLLSYPSTFARLGMVGGVIATVGLAILAYLTCWIMVDFKMKHMGVLNYGDAMGVVLGKWGKRVIGTGVVLKVS